MKKESWLGRNAFWLLAILCGGLDSYFIKLDRTVPIIVLGALTIFSLVMGIYYITLPNLIEFDQDKFNNAVATQVRKKALKVIDGGKS